MPRAAPASGSTLRRNQACKTCRKKKLKCDALRPHCTQCKKHWQGLIAVPPPEGYAHPTEPQCHYDPIEGLTLLDSVNPAERIRELEEQVADLKRRLQEAGSPAASEPSVSNGVRTSPAERRLESLAPPHYTVGRPPESDVPEIVLPQGGLSIVTRGVQSMSPISAARSSTGSPDTHGRGGVDGLLQLFATGWNPDLPDPPAMRHLIDLFFAFDTCGSRILHEPSFRESMLFSPKDERFPHSAILHAICASASRFSQNTVPETVDGVRRDRFAEYHAGKTRQYIDRTMASGNAIFQVLQACIIISWYFYAEGRWVEVWIFSGFQTRVSIPLRLYYKGTHSTHAPNSPGAYLSPPKDKRELELRRRTWWVSIILDRMVSVGGWLHGIEHKNIYTELPMRMEDFRTCRYYDNPQTLQTDNFYTNHPRQSTDSFILFLKAIMLFGLVTDFNNEFNLKHAGTLQSPLRNQNFRMLEKLVAEDFIANLPPKESVFVSTLEENGVDSDLYMAHLAPHAATITLHNPYMDLHDLNSFSTSRCLHAANKILELYYAFRKAVVTDFQGFTPLVKLHPFVTICWYLAAVVKIQVCKHMIDSNLLSQEIEVWGEINAMRHALLEYGTKVPIGTRQEKLLGTLMNEIVSRTKQEKPLEIGTLPASNAANSRLYPHSHRTAFEDPLSSSRAPLPASPPTDQFDVNDLLAGDLTGDASNGMPVRVPYQVPQDANLVAVQGMWYASQPNAIHSQAPQNHISQNTYMR